MSHVFRLLLSIFILLNSTLNASTYDDDVLNIFSKVLPRFILMSSKKDEIKKEIRICILHDNIDEKIALSLVRKTNDYYPNGIKEYQLKFIQTNYSDISKCDSSVLLFLLNSNDKNIKQTLKFSRKYKKLTISYDAKLLEDGTDISMFLGRKIIPYININSIREKKIELNNNLLRISKIYKEKAK